MRRLRPLLDLIQHPFITQDMIGDRHETVLFPA